MPIKTRGRGGRGRPKKKQVLQQQQHQPDFVTDHNKLNINTENYQPSTSTTTYTPTSAKYKPREERSYKDFYPDLNIKQPLSIIHQPETIIPSTQQSNVIPAEPHDSPSKTSLIDLTGQYFTNAATDASDRATTTTSATTTDTESATLSAVENHNTTVTLASPPPTSFQSTKQEATTSTAGALWKEPSDGESNRQDDTYPALSSRLQVHHTTVSGAVDLTALPKPHFVKVTDDMKTTTTTTTPKKSNERHTRRHSSHQVDGTNSNGTPSGSDNNEDSSYHGNNDLAPRQSKTKNYSRPENHYIRYTEPTEEALFDMVEYDMDEQDEAWLELLNKERQRENLGQVSCSFFENVIDKLEKEWFDLVKHLPKQVETGATVPEDSTCAICEDGECENSNAIVFCDGCNLAVHQDCYGVPYIPEGQWLCRKCMVSPDKPVSCLFCPNEGGAFKQTNTNKWGHLLCAIWIPEIGVSNSIYMEPIDNIDRIPKSRWKLTCYICKKRHGACIQCDNKHCFTAFHVTCARWARLCMRMKSHGTHYDSVQLKAYCDRHTPRDYRDEVDVERCVLAAQKYFGPKSQRSRGHSRFNYTSKQRHVDEMININSTDDEFNDIDDDNDDGGSNDNDNDIFVQPHYSRGSTSKNLKRKGKESNRQAKKRKSYSITGTQQLTPSLKAARAHQHHYSAGAPIAPDYILTKLENVKNVRQATQLRKRSELIASICRYWSLKRESRRGAPLLKRLHLEPWTASSSQFKKNEFDMAHRAEAMMILRSDLERVRMLSEQVQKREKLKLEKLRRQKEYVEIVLFPMEYMVKPILNQLIEMDKKEFFLHPVTADVAPDYHDVIKHPMAFSDIIDKLHSHEYATMDSIENDLSLIWSNCKAYNRMETPYYRQAHRMEGVAAKLMAQAREDYKMLDLSPQSGALETGIDTDLFSYDVASSIQQAAEAAAAYASSHPNQLENTDVVQQSTSDNEIISASKSSTTTDTTRAGITARGRRGSGSKHKMTTAPAPTPALMKRSLRSSGAASVIENLGETSLKKRKTQIAVKAPPPPPPPPPPPQIRKSKRIAASTLSTATPERRTVTAAAIPVEPIAVVELIESPTGPTEPIADVKATATTETVASLESVVNVDMTTGKPAEKAPILPATTATSDIKEAELQKDAIKPSQTQGTKASPLTPSSTSSLGSSLSSAESVSSTTPSSPSSPPSPSPSKSKSKYIKSEKVAKPVVPNRPVLRSAGPAETASLIKSSSKPKKLTNEIKNLQQTNLAMERIQYTKGKMQSSMLRAPRGYQYLSSDDEGDNNGNRTTAASIKESSKYVSSSVANGAPHARKSRLTGTDFPEPGTSSGNNINKRPRRALAGVSESSSASTTTTEHNPKSTSTVSKTPVRNTKASSRTAKTKVYKAKPGEIVWARVSGFPFHPATVIDLHEEEIPKPIYKKMTPERNKLVKFFKVPVNHQWGWVKPMDVRPFGDDQDDKAFLKSARISRGKKKSRYAEVLAAYEYVCRKLKGKMKKSPSLDS